MILNSKFLSKVVDNGGVSKFHQLSLALANVSPKVIKVSMTHLFTVAFTQLKLQM